MHVCIADNSNLIDPVSRAVCCASDKKRIRIVVLKCETAVRIWESRHCAQADARVVIGKGEYYLRRIRSHAVCYGPKRRMTCSNLRCFSNRSRFTESRGQSSYRRSCPHGKRANDGHTCEEQNDPESVEVRFHRFFFGSRVQCLHLRGSVFGSRTNVFLSDKAETAVKTRQVFVDALRRAGAFPGASSRKVNERSNHNPCRCDRSWRTMCSRSPNDSGLLSEFFCPALRNAPAIPLRSRFLGASDRRISASRRFQL